MSNYSNEQDRLDSETLENTHISDTSPEFRNRVLNAAHNEWKTTEITSADVPWGLPVLRLAASLAIALGFIYSANSAGSNYVSRWQPVDKTTTKTIHSSILVKNAASPFSVIAGTMPKKDRLRRLRNNIRLRREMLNETRG